MEHEEEKPCSTCVAYAHPSLALVKYWGKRKRGVNVPATTSVAVTLSELCSTVRVSLFEKPLLEHEPSFTVDGVPHSDERLRILCKAVDAMHCGTLIRHRRTKSVLRMLELRKIAVKAENNFATAAGLASSASGGAALTLALLSSLGIRISLRNASILARHYSGSACRSIFGGFVQWKCGADHAKPLVDEHHWSDFRVIVLTVAKAYKHMTSRDAMASTRETSAYYPAWLRHNNALAREAVHAVVNKNIEKLGEISVRSYTAMHASAFTAYAAYLNINRQATLIE